MYKGKSISALIVAAGDGLRFGGNKLLKEYDGIPIINYTLKAFCGAKIFDRIILAVNERLLTEFTQITRSFNPTIIIGGGTRTESVRAGLSAVDTDFVVIADGARPFVTKKEIIASLARAFETGSGVAAIKSTDTVARARAADDCGNNTDGYALSTQTRETDNIKKTGSDGLLAARTQARLPDGREGDADYGRALSRTQARRALTGEIINILDRETLYNLQTPQSFDTAKIKKAYENIPQNASFPDDSAVFINTFGTASLSEGAPENKKITTAADMLYFAMRPVGARGTQTGGGRAASLPDPEQPAGGAARARSANAIPQELAAALWARATKKTAQTLSAAETAETAIKIGGAFDLHRLEYGRRLILGGVELPFEKGLSGHSDADCVIHALVGGILNALGLKDIGNYFPDDDPRFKDAASKILLDGVLKLMRGRRYALNNISLTIIAQTPKLSPYIDAIKNSLSRLTGCSAIDIGVGATTPEGLGDIGEGRAIACMCALTIKKY
jgi:2-C-methyl-D-erythritol 2,4-cyclodiphosphate synthase